MSPRKPSGFTGTGITTKEFQNLAVFFKELLADNPLIRASIIAAGIGGALEGLHIIWLAARFLLKC
jgi:hypothetical protein